MAKTTPFALALIAALAALPLAAQTTDATTPAAPVEGDTATAGDLSLGQEVNKGGVGETYVAAKFEEWEQRCVRTESGADPCQLYKLLKDAQGNNVADRT